MLPSKLLINTVNNVSRIYSRNMRKNPGINKRIKMLSSPSERVKEVDAVDLDLDELESDFMNVHKSHRQHREQLETMKEQEKFFIVKEKYFKETYPNFLTWHDKVQIRHLHSTDPEEWTVEKLSEGFPALPEVIAKIIKSNWSKKSESKIYNHDRHVQENWKTFKEGKMIDLPLDLREHLKKFTNRALIFTHYKDPNKNSKNLIKVDTKRVCTEFSDIIKDYENLKIKMSKDSTKDNSNNDFTITSRKNQHEENKPIQDNNETDTYYQKTFDKSSDKQLTLESLRMKVEQKASAGRRISEDEQLLISQLEDSNTKRELQHQTVELKLENLRAKDATPSKFMKPTNNYVQIRRTDVSHLIYPERITIPSKLRKRGYTYKVNDCFYDDDGQFLYRVPGMVQ